MNPGKLPAPMQQINLGIIGGGTVGGGVFQAIQRNGALISSRLGARLHIAKMVVRNVRKPRSVKIPPSLLTTNWAGVVNDPRINLIVELMGGVTTAREVVLNALKLGKPVVTANKALLSAHGEELFAAAQCCGTNLYYEASVAGGIPIIKVLREGLIGNRITRLYGIVNGTCNYILTRMKLAGADFTDVLSEAQRLGYAETEPSLDIDGHDAAHKIGILASLAHGFWVNPKKIYVEGIRRITRLDIQFAGQLGYTIKLLGLVKKTEAVAGAKRKPNGCAPVQVSVYPTLVPDTHVLASVNDVFNAIYVRRDVVGDTLYYVRLSVIDKPGTLARIAAILGRSKIGISSVIQPEGHEGESVPLILMIHDATNAAITRALAKIGSLSAVKAPPVMIRVENFE